MSITKLQFRISILVPEALNQPQYLTTKLQMARVNVLDTILAILNPYLTPRSPCPYHKNQMIVISICSFTFLA